MTTFVALLRGINVGGNNKLPMADLRVAMEEAGFREVRTYIQSGNVVFTSADSSSKSLKARLEALIANRFGFPVTAIVLSSADLQLATAANPYLDRAADATKLHLGFMADEPDRSAIEALRTKPQGNDVWSVNGRCLYLHARDGIGKSVLAPFVERTLKVPVTFRNWRTVMKLIELAG